MNFNDNTYDNSNTAPHDGQCGMMAEQWLLSPRAALTAPEDGIREPTTSDV